MKHHIVLKLYRQLSDDLNIPDWLHFIDNKSRVRENVNPEIDRLMTDLGLKFWLTREFKPAGGDWNTEEIREGLNRTYRMILQQDYDLPGDLAQRVRLIPSVENARELTIGEV